LIETFSFPELETSQNVIPKERNPHLVYVANYPIRIAFYLDKGVAYVYDSDNRFLGSMDIDELSAIDRRIQKALKTWAEFQAQRGVKVELDKLIYTIGESNASK
jgi:hypothetical protein